jgi:TM2 domain-containing membrane protein YozV
MPDNVIMAILAVAALFAAVFIFIVIFIITDYVRTEQVEHKAPDSHKLIMDLQKTLIDEMKGTSKQNKLMINLTIIFIIISVIGILASVLGAERSITFAKDIGSSISSLFSQALGGFRKASGK